MIHQSNTAAACEAFRERMEKWAELKRNRGQIMDVIVYGDASGNGRRTSAENTDYQIIKLFFRRFGHLFNVQYKVGTGKCAQFRFCDAKYRNNSRFRHS